MKIFIVPGFRQKVTDKSFVWLKKFLIQKGFEVMIVPITWDRRVMSDYCVEFLAFFNRHRSKDNYVLGFSYGAVIAFITANELRPKKIFLCSLSPDFKEDVKFMKPLIRRHIGKNRIKDALTRSGKKIASALLTPTIVFYGEKEGVRFPSLKRRCEETVKLAKSAKLIIVKDAPHDITHPEYIKAIKAVFGN